MKCIVKIGGRNHCAWSIEENLYIRRLIRKNCRWDIYQHVFVETAGKLKSCVNDFWHESKW